MKIDIKKLTNENIEDFTLLVQVFRKVFEWEEPELPSKDHLQKVIDTSNFIVFAAKTDGLLIGGLTAHILMRYDVEKPSAYIYDLAVLPKYQRKGVGKRLISELTKFCEANDFDEAFVQAESADQYAVDFYRTTPITEEIQATHFTYSFDNPNLD